MQSSSQSDAPKVVGRVNSTSDDNRDYPCSVMPDALRCWVFHHQRWTMRELPLRWPSRDGTFRTGWSASLSDWICRQGMGSGVPKKGTRTCQCHADGVGWLAPRLF